MDYLVIQTYYQFAFFIAALLLFNLLFLFYLRKNAYQAGLMQPDFVQNQRPDGVFYFVLGISIIFFFFKIYRLGAEECDCQEAQNIFLADEILCGRMGYSVMVAHQPLYTMFWAFFRKFLDLESLVFLFRLFSLFFTGLTAVLVYVFSFDIFNKKKIALAAFLFFSINGLVVFYSRRAEVYPVFSFFILLSCYYFWRVFLSRKENASWKYSVVNIVCFLLHYAALWVFMAQLCALLWLWLKQRKDCSKQVFGMYLRSICVLNFVIIFFIPAIFVSFFKKSIFYDTYSNIFYLPPKHLESILNGVPALLLGVPPENFVVVGLCLIFFWSMVKMSGDFLRFFVLVSLVLLSGLLYEAALLSTMWSTLGRLYFNIRHLLFLVPFLCMVSGFLFFALIKQKSLFLRIMLGGVLTFVILSNIGLAKNVVFHQVNPPFKKALLYIKDRFDKRGDAVLGMPWLDDIFYVHEKDVFGRFDRRLGNWSNQCLFSYKAFKRLWVVVDREHVFHMPNASDEMFDSLIKFYTEKLILESVWQEDNIAVYLFIVR